MTDLEGMSRRSRAARFTTALAVALPLAAGALVVSAPVASAAVTAPGNGTTFTSHATFEIRADYGRSSSEHKLSLTSPGGAAVVVATAPAGVSGGTLRYSLDTGCWTYPSSSCSGRRPAPNGVWTVSQTGGESSSSTFVTRIPPATPSGVTASALSPREAKVSWQLGAEPDLTGWTVFEGSTVVQQVSRSSCSSSPCSAVITYATEGSGDHTYTVRAARSVAPGSSQTIESGLSAPATTRLESPPPSPEPSTEPSPDTAEGTDGGSTDDGSTDGGGTGGGADGGGADGAGSGSAGGTDPSGAPSASPSSGTGSEGGTAGGGSGGQAIGTSEPTGGETAQQKAVAQRKAFALTFNAFGPKLGIPKLPPLPQAQAPEIAPELADGTYEPTLGFEDRVVRERVEVAQAPGERVVSVAGSAIDSERLVRSTAAALVLLLAGAHLRRWLGSASHEQ